MLYASVWRLDRAACKVLKITDRYSLHRVVYSLFDDIRSTEQKKASVPSGIQWVDKGGDYFSRQILMLSNRLPNPTEHGELRTRALPENFLDHQHYRFTVVMQPTLRTNNSSCVIPDHKKKQKLLPIKGKEAISQWFIERAPCNWGFSVNPEQLQVEQVSVEQFMVQEQRQATQQHATLSGYLTVIDPAKFRASVASGIGRGRSFGCGLLQIVPVIEQPIF
ncbi:MAG: type I-E CRISPR-associated protein Cas6/Cse3/CasE [Enterovibrio sp.]